MTETTRDEAAEDTKAIVRELALAELAVFTEAEVAFFAASMDDLLLPEEAAWFV
jgi:hypothetical protein